MYRVRRACTIHKRVTNSSVYFGYTKRTNKAAYKGPICSLPNRFSTKKRKLIHADIPENTSLNFSKPHTKIKNYNFNIKKILNSLCKNLYIVIIIHFIKANNKLKYTLQYIYILHHLVSLFIWKISFIYL